MSTAGATDEVPESPAKKPESTSEESKEDDDDDYYGRGLRRMTDQERAIYREAVRLSDGFDVPPLPKVFTMGLIRPANSRWPAEFIRRYAVIAIEDQNEKRKKEGGNQLRLKEVIKCNLRVASPVNLYITLEAEDVVTHEVDEYEALVKVRCGKKKDEVHIFRKKNKPALNPPASTEHGPGDSDCAVEDPGKICESSWDRGETKKRRM